MGYYAFSIRRIARVPNITRLSLLTLLITALLAGSAAAVDYPVGDLDEDRRVNIQDLLIFAGYWLDEGCSSPECETDLDDMGGVDGADFALLAENWSVGPLVINEIMYDPRDQNSGSPYTDDDDFEYVELYNIENYSVTLQEHDSELGIDVGWKFTDEDESIDFTFPLATTIPPGGYLLLVKDEDAFNYRYTAGGGAAILEWGDGKCKNGGEKINLQMPGDMEDVERCYIRVDRVNYSDGSHPENCPGGEDPWPSEPDGDGQSLHSTG